jgi:hypothetical protein
MEAPVNRTAQFLGDAGTWSQAGLVLDDVHGLWGGRIITINGSGNTVLRLYSVAQWEQRFELQLASHEVQRLFELCIEHDLLRISFPQRTSFLPDEVRPTITLINASGQRHSVSCWAGDPRNTHFEVLYAILRRLEDLAT